MSTRRPSGSPAFFATPDVFRAWMRAHHASAAELVVGFHKKGSGRPSITWPGSVDVALCFGWIDGVRRRIDATSYSIRFTPRKANSTWSAINIKRVKALTTAGLMHQTGLTAFAARVVERSGVYSYEQRRSAALEAEHEARFRSRSRAWEFFRSQPPWYQRTAIFWVVSAKREETRAKRLATLIADSQRGRRIAPLARTVKTVRR